MGPEQSSIDFDNYSLQINGLTRDALGLCPGLGFAGLCRLLLIGDAGDLLIVISLCLRNYFGLMLRRGAFAGPELHRRRLR